MGGGAQKQLYGSFTYIGAHQDFQKLEFLKPELLLKELRIHRREKNCEGPSIVIVLDRAMGWDSSIRSLTKARNHLWRVH